MPESSAAARDELAKLIDDGGLTRRQVARELKKSEAWLSRRLSGSKERLDIDDYNLIKKTTHMMLNAAKAA